MCFFQDWLYFNIDHVYVLFILGLVVLTQMAGFAIAPGAFDLWTFMFATVGTSLTSASANATNQVQYIIVLGLKG